MKKIVSSHEKAIAISSPLSSSEIQSYYIAQDGLKLGIILMHLQERGLCNRTAPLERILGCSSAESPKFHKIWWALPSPFMAMYDNTMVFFTVVKLAIQFWFWNFKTNLNILNFQLNECKFHFSESIVTSLGSFVFQVLRISECLWLRVLSSVSLPMRWAKCCGSSGWYSFEYLNKSCRTGSCRFSTCCLFLREGRSEKSTVVAVSRACSVSVILSSLILL